MSDWLVAILLGVIEGVTEFLPVSSTGHLLLVENLGWLPRQSELFNTVVQCGAVLAVLLVFTGRLRQLLAEWRTPATRLYVGQLAAAFILTGIGGLIIKKAGFHLPKTAAPVAWATLIGGVAILAVERWLRNKPGATTITWQLALAVGAAQLVAGAFPGTSRSGATILVAIAMGLARPAAAEFSFLVGIPTLFAAGFLEIFKARHDLGAENWTMVAIGTGVAAVTAFAVVKWLLGYVQRHNFVVFGWYRIALGLGILLWAGSR
jgi:undecaprenyl-diphosphatase